VTPRALPPTHRTAHLFIDESGIARQSPIFVLGAVRFTSGHGRLINELTQFRHRSQWRSEMHFSEVKRSNAHLYREIMRIAVQSGLEFTCLVINRTKTSPLFRTGSEPWKTHAQGAIALINRAIVGHEIVSVTLDDYGVPAPVNFEEYIRTAVNRTKRRLAVATVCRMDSRACWGIQLADVLAGAVGHQYRQLVDPRIKASNTKGQLAAFVAGQFNVESFVDADTRSLHVLGHTRPAVAGM
jgi:hypothetical protein